ncbi:MAG: AAA family ATPase [Patescibacteria group bacterium]
MTEKPEILIEIEKLEKKIKEVTLPPELKEKLEEETLRLRRLAGSGGYTQEYVQISTYVDWVCRLPWIKRSDDILDLDFAKKILDKNHYGLGPIKERILEYLAVLKLKRARGQESERVRGSFMRAPILCFVGLVGTGKTTIAYSIAEAMGRKFERIPFGGMGDPLYLRGQSRVHPDSEPGQVIKALRRAGTKNPVILLDEIDRVVEESRATIMGVLVELLDPEQNMAFSDHYLDYPFDLSEVLFIATANNTTNISTAVMDRLEPMMMPSYTDEEKITIGRDYILPRTIEEAGLTKDNLEISEVVWPKIVRPLGYDAGVRTLERTINGICRKVAKMMVEKKDKKFRLTEENIKEFLPTW